MESFMRAVSLEQVLGKPLVMPRLGNLLPGVPLVDSPFFLRHLEECVLDSETRQIAVDLYERGYAVIDFPEPEFEALADDVIEFTSQHIDLVRWREEWRTQRMAIRMPDAWRSCESVRKLAINNRILRQLGEIYNRRAFPFQTINFPVGSQQHFHSDSIHINSFPNGFLCAVWIALEDVDESNGPLILFPGTHRLPFYSTEHVGSSNTDFADVYRDYDRFLRLWEALVANGYPAYEFHPRRGQAIIWVANLLHGGAIHRDPQRTRHSQVTHVFFEDCAYYVPLTSHPFRQMITLRPITDIVTELSAPHRYQGGPLFQQTDSH